MKHRGECSCGWRGPWRLVNTDAQQDVNLHCWATKVCEKVAADVPVVVDDPASLMPHERARGRARLASEKREDGLNG